jgi:hypothetical protein
MRTANARILSSAMVLISALVYGPKPTDAAVLPHVPPRVCEIRQRAWCIYFSDATIEDRPAQSAAYTSVWSIRGSYWASYPLIIREPRGCRQALSDTVQLLDFNKHFNSMGQTWNRLTVRLMKNGGCDLVLLSPTLDRDPRGLAFFAGLGLIQACETSDCQGPVLGTEIRDLVNPDQ